MRQISVTSLDPDADYLISVRAIDADGLESEWSLPLSHTTGPAKFSDGLAPESSPEPVTVGGLRQIFVKWERTPNKDIVEYEVHCVKSDTAPTVPPVSEDPTTMIATTAATMIAATALPNGEPFQYQPDGVENTEENAEIKQNYWFSIIATDKDGPAEAASSWVAGNMDRTAAGDLVAGAITAELVNAVLIFAGEFKLQGGLISISPPNIGDNGELIGGIVVYDPANPENKLIQLHPHGSYFNGAVEANILTILQDFELQGTGSLESGASMKIANGVPDPDKPATITSTIPVVQNLPSVPSGYTMRGMCFGENAAGAGNHYYFRMLEHNTNKKPYLQTINASTGEQVGSLTALPVLSDGTMYGHVFWNGSKPPRSSYAFSHVNSGGITYYEGSVYYLVSQRAITSVQPQDFYPYWALDNIVTFLVRSTPAGVFQNYIETGGYRESYFWDGLAHYKAVGLNNGPSTAIGKILVSGAMVDSDVAVRSFNPNLSAEMDSIESPQVGPLSVVRFVGIDEFDFNDGPKLVIGQPHASYVINTSNPPTNTLFSATHDAVKTFGDAAMPYVTTARGFFWHKTRNAFVINPNDTSLRQFSNYYPPSGEFEYWAVKYVNTGDGGKTTRESPVSLTVPVHKRDYLSVTLPPAPQGVTNAEVYAGQVPSGDPTTFYKHSTSFAVRTGVLWNGRDRTGTTVLPIANNFGGNPGKLFSDVGGFEVNGDGTGSWPLLKELNDPIPGMAVRVAGTHSSIPSNITTRIDFNTVVTSRGGMTLENGTIVVPKDGWYSVSGNITFAASTSSARRILMLGVGSSSGVLSNYFGSATLASAQSPASISGLSVSANVYLEAGQCVGLAANVKDTTWGLQYDQSYYCNLQAAYMGP